MNTILLRHLSAALLPLGAYAAPTSTYTAVTRSYLTASQHSITGSVLSSLPLIKQTERTPVADTQPDIIQLHVVKELVIIDAAVPDKQVFYRGVKPGVDIVEIDSATSGLAQLTTILARYKNLTALHIVSHAEDGVLHLGNSRIDAAMLKQEVETFAALQGALVKGADLLLYGCDLAGGEKGEQLLDIIRSNTHLDIAASTNKTGNTEQGGDWDLEIQRGHIETGLAFSEKSLRDFSAVLAPTAYNSLSFCWGPAAPGYGAGGNGDMCAGPLTSQDGQIVLTASPAAVQSSGPGWGPGYSLITQNAGPGQNSGWIEFSVDGVNLSAFTLSSVTRGYTMGFSCESVTVTGTRQSDGNTVIDDLSGAAVGYGNDAVYTPVNLAGIALTSVRVSFNVCTQNVSYFNLRGFTIVPAATNTAPVNNVLPAITGTATVGNALSGSTGSWTDADNDLLTYSRQWYRADNASGTNRVAIGGATAATYTLTTSDAHKYIQLVVTANDGNGGITAANSAYTQVLNSAPNNSMLPSISGTATVGNALSTTTGTWTDADDDSLTYSYQWYRADDNSGTNLALIAGATSASYTLTTSDAHKYLRVVVTANDGKGGATPANSAYTQILNSAPVNSVAPTVSGTATVGNALSTTNGTWTDADGDGRTYSYQWYRADDNTGTNLTAIIGATNASYTLTSGDTGKFLRVTVTANDGYGGIQAANSAYTLVLGAPGAPTIGTATAGDGQVSVSFTAPVNDGGESIDNYEVIPSPAVAGGPFTGSGSPIVVTGLTNGTAYTFTVTATNAIGTSVASGASNSATPMGEQTITFANPGTQNFGSSPTLTATASSGLTVSFSSSTTGVCTITSSGVMTFVTAGSCTIDANQAGNSSTNAAPTVSQTFTVNAIAPSAPTIGTATAGNTQASVTFTAPASSGGAAITSYTVTSNPGGFTGTGAGSPITVAGLTNGVSYTFTVTATNSAALTGAASIASNAITPASPQTITFNNPGAQTYGTSPTLTATSDSGLTPTFSSSTTGVCAITSGGVLTFVTAGTCTINADQAGDSSYLPAGQVSRSFTVNPAVPGAPTIGTAVAGDTQASVAFSAPNNTGGVVITGYTVTVNPAHVTPVVGAASPIVVTGLTNGQAYTFTVTADNVAGTGPASAASNSVTPAATQTITFNNPGAQNFGTTPTLTASSDSGLTPVFTSATPAVCTITTGGLLTFVTAGTCTINADQAGNSSYLAATQVSRSFTVNAVAPAAPTIGTATAGNTQASVAFTAPTFTGGAAITSYLVTANPGGATATGTTSPITVTGLSNGTAYTFTVKAINSVDSSMASAASNAVTPIAAQSITFNNPGEQSFGSTLNLVAAASSNLPVTFSSATSAVCEVNGTTVTFSATGSCTINANQVGDDAYLAAAQVSQSFNVVAVVPGAPVIGTASAVSGTEASITFSAPTFNGGSDILSYTVRSQPDDLTVTGVGSPLSISGLTGGQPYTFTVIATNAAGNSAPSAASNSISLNSAPVISGTPGTQISRGNTYSFIPTVTDAENDSLTFSIVNKPGWASFNTATGELSGTPAQDDIGITENIVISVSDGEFTVSLGSFNITVSAVNDAPQISGAPATTVLQDQVYSFTPTASDPDGDTLIFSIENKPVWASFDTATGQLSGTPLKTHVGTTTGIVISVSDGEYSAALPAFAVEVINVNEAPSISGNPATSVQQGQAYSFVPTASDPDEDTLTFSITNKPVWASFDTATGALTGTPQAEHLGSSSGIVISVTDGEYSAALPAFTIEVLIANRAPSISGNPATSVQQGQAYSFVPTASDPDGDTLTFSIVNRPVWASFDPATGALSGTPQAEQLGSTSGIVISVTDGEFSAALPAFTIEVLTTNRAPSISGNPATSVQQGQTYSFVPTASDPDGDTLTFSIVNRPVWASFDPATGALSGTPQAEQLGSTSGIVISVTDGEFSAALPAFTIEVVEGNRAPIISGNPATSVQQGQTYSFVPTASDPDGDTLTFSIVNKPVWASFDPATGALTGSPERTHVGQTDGIVISVSDSALTASLSAFNLEVLAGNAAPVAVDDNFTLPFSAAHSYLLDVLANDSDPDGDTLLISAAKASIGEVSIQNNSLLFIAPDNFSGTATFSYSITDGELTDTAAVTLQIAGSNPDAPLITTPADLIVNATGLFTKVDVGVATAVDAAGNRVAVSLVNGSPVFAPGRHELYWQATDAAGLSSTKTQLLQVRPLVSLSKPELVINRSSVAVEVILNGPAPDYPVEVSYTVSGSAANSEHTLVSGAVQVVSGVRQTIHFDVFADLDTVPEKDIVITLNEGQNLGSNASTTITVTEANLAPTVLLQTQQQGESRLTVGRAAGLVTVAALASDPNPGDSISLRWQADAALENIATDVSQFVFDPANLAAGVYQIAVTATDDAAEPLSRLAEIYILVLDVLPELGTGDSNNNLIPDNIEGLGDSNGNGIPDYLDPGFDCNVIPEQLTNVTQFVAEGEPGICLRKGAVAAAGQSGGIQLTSADLQWLEPDMQATNIGGVFDFILRNLPVAGASYALALPQRQAVPENAVYRKFQPTQGWTDFVIDERNQIHSAAGEPGFCPPPGSAQWQSGLTAGHWCIQLTIEDGGPNDADGVANGSIVDPGGIAVILNGNRLPVALDDNYSVQWNQLHILDVLANDSDPDNDTLRINQASAAFGSVSISEDGLTLVYTPPQDYLGTDTLNYAISDGNNGSASATVTVEVFYNRPPTVSNSTAKTDDRTVLEVDVLANASDPDGDALVISSASAQRGTVSITATQRLRYTPQSGFAGVDTISFTISDQRGGSANGTLAITVTAYEVVTVTNKSSGGTINAWWLLLVAVLLFRKGQPLVIAVALLGAVSFSANAQWSADLQLGQSKSRMSETELRAKLPAESRLVAYDDKSNSWALGVQYQATERLAAQLHYVDLGETSVTLAGDTLTPQQYHQAVSDLGPMFASGMRLGGAYTLLYQQQWQLQLQTGMFFWRSKQESVWNNTTITHKNSGSDWYWGAQLSYKFNARWALQGSFNRYRLEANQIDNLMLGLNYRF